MISISFLTRNVNEILLKFAENIQNIYSTTHKVYIFTDNKIPKNIKSKNVKIVYVPSHKCKNKGFIKLLFGFGSVTAWDKAFFYFYDRSKKSYKKPFSHYWFIEDDVFIPSINTINNIDILYPQSDLLTASNNIYITYQNDWHWHLAKDKIGLPWANSMVCACRLSNKLLLLVFNYIIKNKHALYHEFFFNTLALHNNLSVHTPKELYNIFYRNNWTFEDVKNNRDSLFHPVKDLNIHIEWRKKLQI